jgi:hypothetical protein
VRPILLDSPVQTHFSKFIWLYTLTDKEAATITAVIGPHFKVFRKHIRV